MPLLINAQIFINYSNEVLLADEFLACEPGTWIRFSYMPIDGESLRNSIRSASEQVVPYIYKYIVVSPLEPQKLLDAVNLPAAQFHSQTGILQVNCHLSSINDFVNKCYMHCLVSRSKFVVIFKSLQALAKAVCLPLILGKLFLTPTPLPFQVTVKHIIR